MVGSEASAIGASSRLVCLLDGCYASAKAIEPPITATTASPPLSGPRPTERCLGDRLVHP
jgi:hypothetical protein